MSMGTAPRRARAGDLAWTAFTALYCAFVLG